MADYDWNAISMTLSNKFKIVIFDWWTEIKVIVNCGKFRISCVQIALSRIALNVPNKKNKAHGLAETSQTFNIGINWSNIYPASDYDCL